MRRWMIAAAVVMALNSGLAWAQPQQSSPPQGGYGSDTQGGGMMQGRGMGPGMMQGRPGYGRGLMPGHEGGLCMGCVVACASMVMPQLTATSDGGVVVAIGGKLVKYDASLREIAEVNVQIDWTQVQQRVEQMVQNCPMHRRMMQGQQGQTQGPPQVQRPPQGQFQGQPQRQYQGPPREQFRGQ